jgi:hypothetical protein
MSPVNQVGIRLLRKSISVILQVMSPKTKAKFSTAIEPTYHVNDTPILL